MTMSTMLIAMPGNEQAVARLTSRGGFECGQATVRRFPDGESYIRIESAVDRREVALVCTLDRPDDKLLPLLFMARTARELGATRIGLVAPYLAYLRQDRRFKSGESVTSQHFAAVLSECFDWIVTVDPHLHRYCCLDALYTVRSQAVHAATLITEWIQAHVERPLIVGPDSESEQWVRDVARQANAQYTVLEKTRRGDRDVDVTVPDVDRWRDHTPVVLDDIISTARTMIETTHHLTAAGLAAPTCIGVHAIFAGDAFDELRRAGAGDIVTCNTVAHPSNAIDVTPSLVAAVHEMESVAATENSGSRESPGGIS